MFDLSLTGWLVVGFCAFVVGVSKTGLPGLGILHVPLMAMILPARQSTGALLGIVFLRRIPQRAFNSIVQILAAAAAVKLLF